MVEVSEMRNVQEATPQLPSWRIDRARVIIDKQEGRWHPAKDDQLVVSLVRYFAAQRVYRQKGLNDDQVSQVLYRDHRLVHLAVQLSTAPNRYIVEARILAGQSDDAIANDIATHAEAVDVYEQLFFNVRDRLHQHAYINEYAIGPVIRRGVDDINNETLAKYIGYVHGSAVLDLFLYGPFFRARPSSLDEVGPYLDSCIENAIKLQGMIHALTSKLSKFDTRTVFDAQIQYQLLAQRTNLPQEQSDWIASFMGTLRRITPIPRGAEADNIPADSPLRNYSAGQVELRAEEQLRAASKGGLPYFAALQNYRLHRPENLESSEG